MATNERKFSHLPHVRNMYAAQDQYDPMYSAIFEVQFDLPDEVKQWIGDNDEEILTQHVVDVSGLDALNKVVGAGQQKFMGVDVSFLNPSLDNTYCEFTINFNLNIRNKQDAYIFNIFKIWSKLGYNLSDGTRTLHSKYMSDSVRIAEAGRDGTVWRIVQFHRVMLIEVTGLDSLNYTTNDARILSCKFRADWWNEHLGGRICSETTRFTGNDSTDWPTWDSYPGANSEGLKQTGTSTRGSVS